MNRTTTNIPDLTLEHFNRYSTHEIMGICELNRIGDIEVEIKEIEGLRYLKAHNVLRRPLEFRDLMLSWPAENKEKSAEEGHSFSGSKSPGLQQPIERVFMTFLGYQLYDLCKQYNFLKYKKDAITWKYYTNYYYNGMRAFNKNYLPHVDPFSFAANIFVTDSSEYGTSFFKYVDPVTKKSFYSMAGVMSSQEEIRKRYTDGLSKWYGYEISDPNSLIGNSKDAGMMQCTNGDSEWVYYEGDDFYQRYHFLPSSFNSLSMYRGNRWHSATFDAKNSKRGRYSMVACIL